MMRFTIRHQVSHVSFRKAICKPNQFSLSVPHIRPEERMLQARVLTSTRLFTLASFSRRSIHFINIPSAQPAQKSPKHPWRRISYVLIGLVIISVGYQTNASFRHSILAVVRCTRLMKAVLLDVWDYRQTFARESLLGPEDLLTDEERAMRRKGRQDCHRRSASRMLDALKKNSGVYVKIGQHVAAVQVLPKEWTTTMTPLQDQCLPTPIADIDNMLQTDLGLSITDLFLEFDPTPIGVASLAQVHRAIDRRSGRPVAVKLQHAELQEFAMVDMATVNFAIKLVKHVFPDFEFGWLGEEMNEMLPLEMNFRHEAANSMRCGQNFSHLRGKTSLYLPEVLWAERRCLVMEYIDGARVDDLAFLQKHRIDRNQVSQELSRIFSQMVYINGFFHADPHHGNILIRPKALGSSSPFNFDVCLLDHGQYFDIPRDLRVNYARFWLSLMTRTSDKSIQKRKKYARLVGNIEEDMYPFLESAITGRINMTTSNAESSDGRPSSLLDDGNGNNEEIDNLRVAMMEREGLIVSIFELLRTVPRRLLMILKLSDLQRSLDFSLATTHGRSRVYVIIARYCARAVWQADRQEILSILYSSGFSLRLATNLATCWLNFVYFDAFLGVMEWGMDIRARFLKVHLFLRGLSKGGFQSATEEMAGLVSSFNCSR